MKILAMDTGFGTQDILLYDTSKKIPENMNKLVIDSPTTRYARKIRRAIRDNTRLVIYGYTIGGGPVVAAIKEALRKNIEVIMTEKAAKTIRENLDVARELGIEILPENEIEDYASKKDTYTIELKEIDAKMLKQIFYLIGENIEDIDMIAVAVQDHGVPDTEISQREFRFELFRENLKKGGRPKDFAYPLDNIPAPLKRMQSIKENIKREFPDIKGILMDTSPATLFGILYDDYESFPNEFVGVNVGNGHTLAGIFTEGRLIAIFEEHTHDISVEKLNHFLSKFVSGNLTFQDIFKDGGHGAYYLELP
ncbi:MAG: hypothetical protein J7L47_07000, partial [Candidatus Odinarchaeota archaeon]|nr:hypothetical protein [Candidatus Odinarchaeota archaeon]